MNNRPICSKCNKKPAEKSYRTGGWRSSCYLCRRGGSAKQIKHTNNRNLRNARRRAKLFEALGSVCVRCGFVPEDLCQIDFDHIDGNHKNNDISNIQPLCSNCHRIKTIVIAKDNLKPTRESVSAISEVSKVRWL